MKPVSYLIEYCKAQVGLPYWYGCFGQKASATLYSDRKHMYPSYYTASDFSKQYGKKVHDCAGLIKGAAWCASPTASPVYRSSQDWGATTMYNKCPQKGSLPNASMKPGTLVFKGTDSRKSHVGVYIGNGKVIEAKGHSYGVIESTLNSSWKYWGESSLFDYSCYDTEQPQTDTQPKLVFDDSICKKCAGITMTVATNKDPLMLRKSPSGTIIAEMPKGAIVTWKGYKSGDWYYVTYNGLSGYAYSKYLR